MRFSTPREMTSEERVEALIELLAESFLFLAEAGKLDEEKKPTPATDGLMVGRNEGNVSKGKIP